MQTILLANPTTTFYAYRDGEDFVLAPVPDPSGVVVQ